MPDQEKGRSAPDVGLTPTGSGSSTAPALLRTPKWKRELRILRRDGLTRYLRGVRALRRFHRSVRAMEAHDEH